jgi:hypothetical protein
MPYHHTQRGFFILSAKVLRAWRLIASPAKIHRHCSEPGQIHYDFVAGIEPHRLYKTSRQDDLASAQALASGEALARGGEMVGEPRQRMMGMAEHIGAGALRDVNAVDDGAADDLQQIRCDRSRHRLSKHATGREEIVSHQCRRAQRLPVGVTIIDYFDRRQIGLDRLYDRIRRKRRGCRRQIARQPNGDFAFDPDANEIPMTQRSAAFVHASGEHAAAAGMRDIEILLHHRAGAADLVTDLRAEIGRQQIGNRGLNQISLGLVPRGDIRIERRQRRAVTARSGDDAGGRWNPVHRRRLPEMGP